MKAYETLTPGGKKRRLRKVVEEAIKHYDIEIDKIDYLTEETSIFFKLHAEDGADYALKIFQDASSTIEDNLAELFLIDCISRKTDIRVPRVLKTKEGQGILRLSTKYTPSEKRIAIYTWLAGIEADGNETDDYFYKLGQVTGKMHVATKDLKLPKDIEPKLWDKVFYYRDEVAVYKEDKHQSYLDETFHETMDFVIPFMDKELKKLYVGQTPQLIHGDINPWNVMIDGDHLNILDFEEALYCLPLHDLAIIFFYYRFDDAFDYEHVKKMVLKGYASIRPVPDYTAYQMELLIMARRVNFINYVLTFDEVPLAYLETNIPRVRDFLKKYVKTCPF